MKGQRAHRSAVSKTGIATIVSYPLESFKCHLNKLPACFVITDIKGHIFFANDAFYNRLDLKPASQQKIKFNFFDMFTTTALARIHRDIFPTVKHHHLWSGKLELFNQRDERIKTAIDCTWIKISKEKEELYACWIHKLPDNTTLSLHSFDEDINVLHALFEMCPNPIYIYNQNGLFLMLNAAAVQSSGYTRKELLAKTVMDVGVGAMQKDMRAQHRKLMHETHLKFIAQQKRKDGSLFPVEVFLCNIQIEGKRQILAYVHDISLREMYQKEYKRNDELRKLLVGISGYFSVVDLQSFDLAVQNALRDLAKFSGVDRCYLFKFDDDYKYMYNIYEWCSQYAPAQIDRLQKLPMDGFPWMKKMLVNNKIIICNFIKELPQEAVVEKREFIREKIKSILIVPLTRDNKVIGTVGFDAVQHTVTWNDYTVQLLKSFSDFICQALDRKETLALQEEKKKYELEMTKKLLNLQEEQLNFFIKHAPAAIAIFDCNMKYTAVSDRWMKDYRVTKNKIIGKTYYEVFGEESEKWRKIHQRCLKGYTYQGDKDIFIGLDGEKDWVKWEIYPRKDYDGKIIGVIMLSEVITERIKYEETILRMSNYDVLTNIPNRKFFSETVTKKLNQKEKMKKFSSALMIGINNLQSINNYFNVFIGDQLLKEVAKRLQSVIGNAFLARLDGDQFAVIADLSSKDQLDKMIQRIHSIIKKPMKINHYLITTSVSIGVRILRSSDHLYSDILRDVAIAMQHAKHIENIETEFFDDDLRKKERRSLVIENEFQKAIDESQFHMVYQPQFCLQTNKYTGIEALIRWHHPKLKNVSPAEFISAAERTGKIIPLGNWIIATVLREFSLFRKKTGFKNDFTVSINISPFQLLNENFFSLFSHEIKKYSVPASLVEIEITEEQLSINPTLVLSTLKQIRGLGCRIAIDDFGTGHSSLYRLKSMPITTLKIDKSFIDHIEDNMTSAALVKHILLLANELELQTVAEGVEKKEQLTILRLLGCNQIQGFYYSKPISLKKVAQKCFR